MSRTIMNAHGSDAVQATRIIAAVGKDRCTEAEAYNIAAGWHDKRASSCDEIANDEPRIAAEIRKRAAQAAVHHRASAAGLRLAASQLLRTAAA